MIQAQNPSNLTRTQTLKPEHMTPYARKLDHSSPPPPSPPSKDLEQVLISCGL